MQVGLKVATVGIGLASAAALLFACGQGKQGAAERAATTTSADSVGALIRMDMSSTVGVLLDEIPAGPQREAAAANALAQPASFWIARARSQVKDTGYRLVFRGQYYSAYHSNDPKVRGPLPLTPKAVWNLQVSGSPRRTKIDGHDIVVSDYTFGSYIVTDAASPAAVEPNLASVGDTWSEPFTLPADPELLLQRTGYACMDEDEFPPGSVFEENTWYFYDDSCTPAPGNLCHVTVTPKLACGDALAAGTGHIKTSMNFTRVAYDPAIAASYRVGTVNPLAIAAGSAADLAVVADGLTDERDFVVRFFGNGSCELGEGVIGKLGWRRLLEFSAIVQNNGTAPIVLGNPADPNNPYVKSNVFEFSACHQHYHFSHYGTFGYDGVPGSKRAFCLEDTNRYHNDESTPLTALHQTCQNQGIGAGWGDEYNFGIPGQWVDVTGVDTTAPHTLSFLSNGDQFLCEGTLQHDAQGNLLFDPTSFLNPVNGLPEQRVRCNFLANWNANNLGTTPVSSPGGSFVTDACTRGQVGPIRDCGFTAHAALHGCTTGGTVTLTCTAGGGAPSVLRVCEESAQLGIGVACTVGDSVANVIVGTTPTKVSFACPAVRDATMVDSGGGVLVPTASPGVGGYSLYQAAMGTLDPTDATPAPVTCTGF
jgi:hypothetical protein